MKLKLAPDFGVLATSTPLPYTPRYSLSGYVTVSPHTDRDSHEALLRETFGSVDWLWSGDDEIRFGQADQLLKGCVFSVPEEAPPATWNPQEWLNAPTTNGGLKSTQQARFALKATETRWVDEAGTLLICARRDASVMFKSFHRFRIAHSLDLVTADQEYVGWILHTPTKHLVRENELPPTEDAPPGLPELLSVYLHLVTEPKVERMMEGDPTLLTELDNLTSALSVLPKDPRRDVVRDRLTDLRNDWYGET